MGIPESGRIGQTMPDLESKYRPIIHGTGDKSKTIWKEAKEGAFDGARRLGIIRGIGRVEHTDGRECEASARERTLWFLLCPVQLIQLEPATTRE